MAEGKETKLSIVIRTVDQATAKINAINERLDAVTKPTRDFKKALGELGEKSGLTSVVEGFKGVGEAVKETLFKVVEVAAVIGETVHLVIELAEHFEDLGKKAERIGVTADFLAGMRDAAERSGASIEDLDSGLEGFSVSLGKAKAGTGRMKAFLEKVSPTLERQLVAAKGNAAAFDILAGAMAKLQDPAKRSALAAATVGEKLAPLFAKGPKGLKELRDHFIALAGPQNEAADAGVEVGESLKDVKAATEGWKAALLTGLKPAIVEISDKLTKWLVGHRADIREWAEQIGKKLPAAFEAVSDAVSDVIDFLEPFFNSGTKIKIMLVALAAVMAGPLISAVVSLGIALLANPIGLVVAAIAALAVAWYEVITNWEGVKAFFIGFWDKIKEKFGWAADVVAVIMAPFIAIPLEIVGHWDDITDFFEGLWDGVTGVFKTAWDFIKGIVDKVVGAVDTVIGATESIGRHLGFGGGNGDVTKAAIGAAGDLSTQTSQIAAATAGLPQQAAKIIVDFANAPRGTRVKTDPESTAAVDLMVGFQAAFGGG